jgi:N-acetylmuramoyl-L-alanine amidase
MKIKAVAATALAITACLSTIPSFAAPPAQNSPALQKARDAYIAAAALEAELNEKSESERTRADYLKVIRAYQRVYLITPRTGYADNSLMTIARLYEETKAKADAIKTLQFLIREYPRTPFKDTAERDLARLNGVKLQGTVPVDNIRYWEAQNSVRIIVDLGGEVAFTQGDAKNPDRVFVDITPAKLNSVLAGKQWPVQSSLLQQIRVGQYDNSTVRVVMDIGVIGRVTSFTLREPDRLVIDVVAKEAIAAQPSSPAPAPALVATAAAATPQPKPAAVPPPPVNANVPASSTVKTNTAQPPPKTTPQPPPKPNVETEVKTVTPPVKPITPAKTTNTRSLVRSLGLKLSRVVIDAGHGGHDTGSVGPNGYTEKELVLDVAQRLKTLIQEGIGADVVMTRNDDSFVALESRTTIANEQEADLFISIHANSSRVRSVRGVETYFLNFTSSREALETATRENAASELAIHELQSLVKKIMLQDKVDESRELAQHVGRALAARKGAGTDRGVKQAPFVVLIGANMPSILAEICFISNPQDEKALRNPDNRQAIADSLFEGVRSYAETLSGTKTAKSQEGTQE